MPKVSKAKPIKRVKSNPGEPQIRDNEAKPAFYKCTRCGNTYKHQRGNFAAAQSSLWLNNGGYLTVCNTCLEEMFTHYKETLGDEAKAIERICMKFDIYWNHAIYAMVPKANTIASRLRVYISKTFLIRYIEKTFDDTLDEQAMEEKENAKQARAVAVLAKDGDSGGNEQDSDSADTSYDDSPSPVPQIVRMDEEFDPPTKETVQFWGPGFPSDMYYELNMRYDRWTGGLAKPLDVADEALYKQICIQEATINRNAAAGKSIEQGQNALNNLLGSLNKKPIQRKSDDDALAIDTTPLGVWAKRWEDKRPIPDDDEDMKDSYGIAKYISVWFYGHLCKMLGVKNSYSKLYEDEINKFRVMKPEYADEEDEDVFNDYFADGDDDGNDKV